MVARTLTSLLLVGLALSSSNVAVSASNIRWGVFAYLGEERTRAEYQPLVDYLNQTLDDQYVILEVLPQPDIEQRIREASLDIVTTNPTHFLVARQIQPLTSVIATRVGVSDGHPVKHLGAWSFPVRSATTFILWLTSRAV